MSNPDETWIFIPNRKLKYSIENFGVSIEYNPLIIFSEAINQ